MLMWISGNKVPKRIHLMNDRIVTHTHSPEVGEVEGVVLLVKESRWTGGVRGGVRGELFIFIGNHFSRLIERHPRITQSEGGEKEEGEEEE